MLRSRMMRLSTLVVLLASGPAIARAQDAASGRPAPRRNTTAPAAAAPRTLTPAEAKEQAARNAAKMSSLLDKWEGQSAKLKTLDVKIARVDSDPSWQTEDHYEGTAMFKSPNLAYLDFARVKVAKNEKGQFVPVVDPKTGKRITARADTVVCAQNEVWHYQHDVRQIIIFPLAKGERQRALDEGPLPFLFNMRKQDALARYDMAFTGETTKAYGVRVHPKLLEDQESFKSAFLFLDKTYLLPSRIVLIAPDGKSTRDYKLEVISPNVKVDDVYFKGGVYKDWKVVKNPGADVANGKAAGRPGGAAAMPRR
jgi:TIGR03009 family protein